MKFEQYFSQENFAALLENDEAVKNNFHTPLLNFLTAMREKGLLSKVNLGEGHDTSFQRYWDSFVDNKLEKGYEETHRHRVLSCFDGVLFDSLYHSQDTSTPQETYYKKFCDTMTQGSFKRFMVHNGECECRLCGQSFKTHFENWRPEFRVFKYENIINKFVKPDSCVETTHMELPITFKTGELLVADWFRIPEFTALLDAKDHSQEANIQHAQGVIKSVKHHLDFGVISVNMRTFPTLFEQSGSLLVGYDLTDKEEYNSKQPRTEGLNNLGRVSDQLWAVTIVERQHLIELLKPSLGESATEVVNNYVKENDVIQVQVEPGNYTLKFDGVFSRFAENEKEYDLPHEMETYLILQKNTLTLKNKVRL